MRLPTNFLYRRIGLKEYFVYKHTSPDGRIYIGITRQNPPSKRWNSGTGYKYNTYFTRTIKKYGWANFTHEILASGLTEDEAKKEEIRLISEYKSNERKYGFNISSGGESKAGTKISEQQKQRISEANKGKLVSQETREKLRQSSLKVWQNESHVQHMREINSGANNTCYGKKLTREEILSTKNPSRVLQFTKSGVFVREYISLHEASDKTGVNRQSISLCCKKKFAQASGYIWRYYDDELNYEQTSLFSA
jgi:group I intron endonuclease